MKIVVDTHTLLWFLFSSPRLSKLGKETIQKATQIVLPTIVLAEGLGVSRKLGIEKEFINFLNKLPTARINVVPFDFQTMLIFSNVSNMLEIHDSIIVATAIYLDCPVVTKDKEITKFYSKVIW